MLTAQEVLARDYVSVDFPLTKARRWLLSGAEARKQEAVMLLRGLQPRFPEALNEIGPMLVLALLECGRHDEARRVLRGLPTLYDSPREEMLSRWGRIAREQGDAYISPEGPHQDHSWELAVQLYREARGSYREAYEIRHGYYPGINVASLSLMIYAVTPEPARRPEDLATAEQIAQELLSRQATWPLEQEDDTVWHLATAADCQLILRRWELAARGYQAAQHDTACQPFHVTCMRRTVQRILSCFERLGVNDFGPFHDLTHLFPSAGPPMPPDPA